MKQNRQCGKREKIRGKFCIFPDKPQGVVYTMYIRGAATRGLLLLLFLVYRKPPNRGVMGVFLFALLFLDELYYVKNKGNNAGQHCYEEKYALVCSHSYHLPFGSKLRQPPFRVVCRCYFSIFCRFCQYL